MEVEESRRECVAICSTADEELRSFAGACQESKWRAGRQLAVHKRLLSNNGTEELVAHAKIVRKNFVERKFCVWKSFEFAGNLHFKNIACRSFL